MPRIARSLPAVAAVFLVALAAGTPASRTAPVTGAAVSSTSPCGGTLQSNTGTIASSNFGYQVGLTQPLLGSENLAGSSLTIGSGTYAYGSVQHAVVAWDPVALAPDPTTVALRTAGFYVSAAYFSTTFSSAYSPAIVRTQYAGVAEPMRTTLALDWYSSVSYFRGTGYSPYDSAASAALPISYQYGLGGLRTPLAGSHAVVQHSACTGDSTLAGLQVVQSVVRCDSLADASSYDVVQSFRVPAAARVHWIEFAESYTPVVNGDSPGWIAIIDPEGATAPPLWLPAPLVQAYLFWSAGASQWSSHVDFDHTVTLQPAHDYWLLLHTNHDHRPWLRRRTGGESANFASHVGPLWWHPEADSAWTNAGALALDFRIVGEVLNTTTGVGAGAGGPRLELRALANPVRGAAAFAWSGARGALRFDVLDVRGRRVGGGAAAAGAAGEWRWTAAGAGGVPLAAGVYFVRATDAAGASATRRVVVVR